MKKRPHLLLADDNPDEVFFIERALKEACPESDLEVVSNGVQAIERLSIGLDTEQSLSLPDALILDLNMPSKGGFDVLRWMIAQHIECPVIIHTSSDEPNDVAQGAELGATGFVIKEVGYLPLLRKLNEILSR